MRNTLCATAIALVAALTPAAAESVLQMPTNASRDAVRSATVSGSTSCLPGEVRAMLSAVARRFGKVTVISSHRAHAVVAGTRRPSYHRNCRAVDFRVAEKRAAWRWINENWHGGAGVYSSHGNHIHIDNGPRRRWRG